MSNESKTRQRATSLLDDLANKVAQRARKDLKVSKGMAEQFGADVAEDISEDWGGLNFYLPKDIVSKVRSRDAQIYDEFTGDNHEELALKYDMSIQYIYRIVRKERERRSVRQHALPL
ncbi:MAG: Mor transcription activator family protein [Pseudodesulfovibrio sp.]|uniref:Mor transcription activator family protein n=1 Tax=Pseudodesulfovibrio sp. TaxID=2035812 RepID=UPI003D0C5972